MTYNFDQIINRRNTDSMKANLYPEDVIPLWVADMDFESPREVVEALIQRAEHGVFGYPMESKGLRPAIQQWLADSFSWEIEPEWILLLPGVVYGMNLTAQALVQPGQSMAYHVPVYPPFLRIAKEAGIGETTSQLLVDERAHYTMDWDAFEASLTSDTAMFLLCSPHNPVGRVWQRAELERLAESCLKRNILVCSDEIHADLIMGEVAHIPFGSLSEEAAMNSVTLMAPSKSFNIPGLNFSFAVVPNEEIRKKLQHGSHGLGCGTNLMGLTAAEAAYRHGRIWMKEVLAYLRGNRDLLVEFIRNELPELTTTEPEGTYLAWVDCRRAGIEATNLGNYFRDHARIAVSEGAMFGAGGEGFIRINFALPRSLLEEGLIRLRDCIRSR